MFQEVVITGFYITSIIGIAFLAFYSITVFRELRFKIVPRINVYFENPNILNETDIFTIDLVVKNEGQVAVQNAVIKFDKDDIFFDKAYSELIFKNKLFDIGVNLGPNKEFRLPAVIHTLKTHFHKLHKDYHGAEYYRDKNDVITAKLYYNKGKKKYKRDIQLSFILSALSRYNQEKNKFN
jgi:hypothetical protein